ncbi:MAG: clostripain-related cysteine peptidase [Mucinivorans sp.]
MIKKQGALLRNVIKKTIQGFGLPLLFAVGVVVVGCNKITPEEKHIARTVIVYINADNNLFDQSLGSLSFGALIDINEMEQAWNDNSKDVLLVYLNSGEYSKDGIYKKSAPTILRIHHDDDPLRITSPVVKTYDKHDASSPKVLSQVIADARRIARADSYALVFWSHGTGWVPSGLGAPLRTEQNPEEATSYSFGISNSYGKNQMEIDDLVRALPSDILFDYIAFDACYMGGIEVAYQLRKSCRYFIGSAVETPIDGFEYDLVMNELLSANVNELVHKTYLYNKAQTGWMSTCAMSVVDCSKLENLAAATRRLTEKSPRKMSDVLFSSIQDLGSSSSFRATYYDFGDFVNHTWALAPDLGAFQTALQEAVPTKYFLPVNLGSYNITTYSGFSCFVPRAYQSKALAAFRERYDWSAASGLGSMQ